MAITKTPRLDQTRWSSGQDQVKREDFDADAAELEANVALFKEGPLAARPAAGVSGRFYTVVGDTNAALNGRQFYDNGTQWAANSYANNLIAEAVATDDTALTVRSQPSSMVNVFAVQDSTAANHLAVTSNGYTTTQRTPGISGGVELGYDSSHDQAGLFVSVDPSKPVVVIEGVNGQTGNLLDIYSPPGTRVAYVDGAGGANFNSITTTLGITSSGPINAPSITSSGPSNLIDAVISSGGQDHIALTVKAASPTQTSNLVEVRNADGTRTARFTQDGTFATDGRVFIGGGQGNVGPQTPATTDAVATFKNSLNPATPVLNLFANVSSQTAKMLQVFDSRNILKFSVDASGNASASSNINAASMSIGSSAPLPYYNSSSPKFEVVTGSATGSFDEAITVRHSATSSTATSRRVGIKFKLSSEANQTESNKWAGIVAHSELANSASPYLSFYTGGQEAAVLDADANFRVYGEMRLMDNQMPLRFGRGSFTKIRLADTNEHGTIGLQTANTMFLRSDNIALYSGGTYNTTGLNAGGGVAMAQFTPDRTLITKLTLTNTTPYDSTAPVFQIGNDTHMQFSNLSINTYDNANNSRTAELNLQNNGGNLRLGNTSTVVSLPSRVVWVGNIDDQGAANAILFARSSAGDFNYWVGRSAQNGDWWFDHTNNRINVHDGTTWHVFVPDHTEDNVSN